MNKELYQNLAVGFLTGSVSATSTTINLTSSTMFPSTGDFMVKCENELIKVTGNAANVLTVVRGQEGTTGAIHLDNTPIFSLVTDGSLRRLVRQSHGGTIIGARREINFIDGGVAWTMTDDPTNDKVDVAGSIVGGGYEAAFTKPTLSQLTWDNQQNATATDVANGVAMVCNQSATAGSRVLYKAIPTTVANQYTAIMRILPVMPAGPYASIVLRDSVNGKYQEWTFNYYSGTQRFTLLQGTSLTSGLGYQDYVDISGVGGAGSMWCKVVEDATNRKVYLSKDGVNWTLLFSLAAGAYLTPDGFGFSLDPTSDRNASCTLLSLTITSP